VLSITDAAQAGLTTRSMTYDALDRMITANSALQWGNGTYDYDPLDNLRVADQSATARTFRYNYDAATNRLSTIKSSGGATLYTFGYDVRGNTTAKNAQHFVFDTANRMSTADLTAGGGTQTYRYDGLGRRVQTTDPGTTSPPMEFWVYSQAGQVLYTSEARRSRNLSYIYLNGSQVATRAYAWETGTIATRFQMTDALGSPVANTDTSGNSIQRTSYGPWGEATPSVDGTGYTGHVMDAGTGLTNMQQRYYDPAAGRFLTSDPVQTNTNTGTAFNRYNYANNNPFKFVDPDGRKCTSTDGVDSCTFDKFFDLKGRQVSRDQALATGGKLAKLLGTDRGSRILKAEAAMTARYTAAKALASRGGEVSIRGNKSLGIPDQKISGAAIVSRMEGITTISNAGPSSEDTPGMVLNGGVPRTMDGSPSNGPMTYYRDGVGVDVGRMFGHEILHTLYSGVGVPNLGWANPEYQEQHQAPFNEASDAAH